ncbi:MAG: hypothetical protein EON93_20335 [Burkholderiales bacterium]|nr:MAG: hypothetical protein EON93_20335 [Burkholderiales bacterium]
MFTGMRVTAALVAMTAGFAACTSSEPTGLGGQQAASSTKACIRPAEIARQDIVSDEEIRFEMRNGDVWVNKLPRKCPSLKFQGGFTWDVRGMMVCSNEQTIYVKDDGTPCQLGAFTRLPKAE